MLGFSYSNIANDCPRNLAKFWMLILNAVYKFDIYTEVAPSCLTYHTNYITVLPYFIDVNSILTFNAILFNIPI